jgi:hypothetical protein
MFVIAQVFGIGIFIFATTVFLTNVFMVGLFVSKRLISVKHESAMIHRLIFNFIICDTIQVTPTIYIGLCNVLQVNFNTRKITRRGKICFVLAVFVM